MNEQAIRTWMEKTLRERFHGNMSEWARAADGMSTSTLHGLMSRGRTDPETLLRVGIPAGMTDRQLFILAGWLQETEPMLSQEALEAARLVEEAEPSDRRLLLAPLRAAAQELKQERPSLAVRLGRRPTQ